MEGVLEREGLASHLLRKNPHLVMEMYKTPGVMRQEAKNRRN